MPSRSILLQRSFIQCILGCSLGVFFCRIASFRALYCRKLYRRSGACGADEKATGAHFFFPSVPFSSLSSSLSLLIELLESLEPLIPIVELGSEGKIWSRLRKIVGDSVETFSMFYWRAGSIVSFSMLLWIWSSCLFASLLFLRLFEDFLQKDLSPSTV